MLLVETLASRPEAGWALSLKETAKAIREGAISTLNAFSKNQKGNKHDVLFSVTLLGGAVGP